MLRLSIQLKMLPLLHYYALGKVMRTVSPNVFGFRLLAAGSVNF